MILCNHNCNLESKKRKKSFSFLFFYPCFLLLYPSQWICATTNGRRLPAKTATNFKDRLGRTSHDHTRSRSLSRWLSSLDGLENTLRFIFRSTGSIYQSDRRGNQPKVRTVADANSIGLVCHKVCSMCWSVRGQRSRGIQDYLTVKDIFNEYCEEMIMSISLEREITGMTEETRFWLRNSSADYITEYHTR